MIKESLPGTWQLLASRSSLDFVESFEKEVLSFKSEERVDNVDFADFFPMFLRHRGASQDLVEFSYWEFISRWVSRADLGPIVATQLRVNPTAQFIELSEASGLLDRTPGIYAVWRDRRGQPRELQLSLLQARALDLFSEGQTPEVIEAQPELTPIMEELKKMDLILDPKLSQGGEP